MPGEGEVFSFALGLAAVIVPLTLSYPDQARQQPHSHLLATQSRSQAPSVSWAPPLLDSH